MTDRDFSKIELLHQELEHHYSIRDHKAYLQRNHVLHKLIQDVTGNKVLKEVIDGLWQKVLLYRYKQLYQGDRFDRSIQEHRDLLEAFRKRDAALTMKQHLMNQCNALINGLMLGQEEQGSKSV